MRIGPAFDKTRLPNASEALPGRDRPMAIAARHAVLGQPMHGPLPEDFAWAQFALGCFWGAERLFWQTPGVWTTAVGYAGGLTPNPSYEEVCSGQTGHAEVVRVGFDPARCGYEDLLVLFWESHDPTQGMRQGGDVGTQYRSAIHCFDPSQYDAATASRRRYADALAAKGLGPITTEIVDAPTFYFAEDYHQQYLHKNPRGYCGLGGTGVHCPGG